MILDNLAGITSHDWVFCTWFRMWYALHPLFHPVLFGHVCNVQIRTKTTVLDRLICGLLCLVLISQARHISYLCLLKLMEYTSNFICSVQVFHEVVKFVAQPRRIRLTRTQTEVQRHQDSSSSLNASITILRCLQYPSVLISYDLH